MSFANFSQQPAEADWTIWHTLTRAFLFQIMMICFSHKQVKSYFHKQETSKLAVKWRIITSTNPWTAYPDGWDSISEPDYYTLRSASRAIHRKPSRRFPVCLKRLGASESLQSCQQSKLDRLPDRWWEAAAAALNWQAVMQYFSPGYRFAESCCLHSSAGNQSLLYFGGGGKSIWLARVVSVSSESLVSPLHSVTLFSLSRLAGFYCSA